MLAARLRDLALLTLLNGCGLRSQEAADLQLRAVGQEVALLALLDSYAPQPGPGRLPDDRQLLAGMAQQLGVTLDLAALQRLDAQEQLAYVLEQVQRSAATPLGLDLVQLGRLFAVYKTNALALLGYTPRSYVGRIALFRASDAPDGFDPAPGWRALAKEDVAIYDVPGKHESMLQEPHVCVLAERLRVAIARAGPEQHLWR